jgi:hypothetical protein
MADHLEHTQTQIFDVRSKMGPQWGVFYGGAMSAYSGAVIPA